MWHLPILKEHTMKHLLCLLAIISFAGCIASYKAPQTYNVEKERIISKSYDAVWDKIVEWFALNASPVKNMDRQSGFIASDFNLSTANYPQYSDCGSGGQGMFASVAVVNPVGNFNILLKRIDSTTTRVIVTCAFKAKVDKMIHGTYNTSHNYEDISCSSKGVLDVFSA
jgi:hypothetical protein